MRMLLLGMLAGCTLVPHPQVVGPPAPSAVAPVLITTGRPVGVTGHDDVPHAYDTARAAGFTWVRIHFRWDGIETSPGVFEWDRPYGKEGLSARQRVAAATAHGFAIMAQISGTPPWTATHAHHRPEDPPSDPVHFGDFMAAAAREFGTQVSVWSLWNEPNYCPQPGVENECYWSGTSAQYRQLILAPGIDGLRSVLPTAKVVAPNTVHKDGALDIGRWITVNGAFVRPLDAVGVHAYGRRAQQVAWVDRFSAWCRNRASCPRIWITEFGFSRAASSIAPDPSPGDAVVAVLSRCRAAKPCGMAFVFRLHEDPDVKGPDDFGLLTAAGVQKARLATVSDWMHRP